MLTSLAKVRESYRTYLQAYAECRERVREEFHYPEGATMSQEHEKLAEQRADQHPVAIDAATHIKTHQPLALTYGVAYLVEVDASWRFDGGVDEPSV